jgi:hypothetical protein
VSRPRPTRLLVLALAASAVVHTALAPTHAAEAPALCEMFALSALALAGVALRVDRGPEPVDAVGAITKLVEAAGIVPALRLLHTPAGRAKALLALRQGAGP